MIVAVTPTIPTKWAAELAILSGSELEFLCSQSHIQVPYPTIQAHIPIQFQVPNPGGIKDIRRISDECVSVENQRISARSAGIWDWELDWDMSAEIEDWERNARDSNSGD